MRNHREIVGRCELRAAFVRDRPRARRIDVREREKTHGRMADRKLRAQRADAPGAYDRNA